MRHHSEKLVKLIQDFYESHLQLCLDILESIAMTFVTADFNYVLRSVLPMFLKVPHLPKMHVRRRFRNGNDR